MNWTSYITLSLLATGISLSSIYINSHDIRSFKSQLRNSSLAIVLIANTLFIALFGLWKTIQLIVFGQLRDIEAKNVYDRLLQWAVLKFLFVTAMNSADATQDTIFWVIWFTFIGFIKSFSLLSRDRLEYITTFNPSTRPLAHAKIVILLLLILACDTYACYFCLVTFRQKGIPLIMLLTFECIALFLDTIQTLVKYGIHIVDISTSQTWESRGAWIYYTEFLTDTLILVLTLGHYIQFFLHHGIHVTLIDGILFLYMKNVATNLRLKINTYRNYRKLAADMKEKYPDVPSEELAQLDDVCAVCHDRMLTAKRLPCSHIFHHSCLRSWLENHHNCPTCRYSLIDNVPAPNGSTQANARPDEQPREGREELFRFNGPRWSSWLPSIQIVSERRHVHPGTRMVPGGQVAVPVQLMQQVQEIFPHLPLRVIAEDLSHTMSVEASTTINNFVEGRYPPSYYQIERENAQQAATAQAQAQATHNTTTTPQPQNSLGSTQKNRLMEEMMKEKEKEGGERHTPSVSSTQFGDTFFNTSQQRQQSLAERRKKMLEHARRWVIILP